jgi:23S rRNA (cytosine1962-C5)-methyltransferase
MSGDLSARLAKNARRLFPRAEREGLDAFRLYDRDIPAWPFAIDWYAGSVHVMDFPSRRQVREGRSDAHAAALAAVAETLHVPPARVFVKTHVPAMWAYEKVAARGVVVHVRERGLAFECNLSDYLDTGLFLDHRETRALVQREAEGRRCLNLFSYTGAFSVAAAAGGAARTLSVDLSATYGAWARRNLDRNGFGPARHAVVRADALAWLEDRDAPERFDLAIVDPPSFSRSERMGRRFEVQRDHRRLLERVLGRMASGGAVYFSTHLRGFELDPRLPAPAELTRTLQPFDLREPATRCFKFEVP